MRHRQTSLIQAVYDQYAFKFIDADDEKIYGILNNKLLQRPVKTFL
jgi:hypothetical protein